MADIEGTLGEFEQASFPEQYAESTLEEILHRYQEEVEAKKGIPCSELLADSDSLVRKLEALGVVKLGELSVPDGVVRLLFKGSPMVVLGWDEGSEADWKVVWCKDLQRAQQQAEKRMDSNNAKISGWRDKVLVEAHLMRIEHGAGPPGTGFLHSVLKRWQQEDASLSAFSLPAIQAVIHYKWQRWAKKLLKIEFAIFLGWMLSFVLFMVMFGDEEQGTRSLQHSKYGYLPSVCLLASVLFMTPFLFIEICTMIAYGWRWLVQFWNMVDVATYMFTIMTAISYFTQTGLDSYWLTVVLASQSILMLGKIQYFSRVYDSKGSMVDTLKVVVVNVRWFLVFMFLTMFAFGGAFYLLYREDRHLDPEFENAWHSVVAMFSYMMGGFHFELFYNSSRPTAVVIFFLIYQSMMAIMLINILIAIMTDSYSQVMEEEQVWSLCSKAQIIDELESTIPRFISKSWNPKYLHVLKVSPRKEVLLESVWTRLGMAEDALEGSGKEIVGRLQRFQGDVTKKLEVILAQVKRFDLDAQDTSLFS